MVWWCTCIFYIEFMFVCVRVSSAVYFVMHLEYLQNPLRSRTRVTIVMFLTARRLKNRLRSRTRVATTMINYLLEARLRACIQRGVFVMHFGYLQNRLRSCTRVTIVMFLIACRFEESAPFSYTCRNYDDQLFTGSAFACVYPARCICYASWKFAESATFSYMYAKCERTRRP